MKIELEVGALLTDFHYQLLDRLGSGEGGLSHLLTACVMGRIIHTGACLLCSV